MRSNVLFWSIVGLLALLLSVVGIHLTVSLAFAAPGRLVLPGDLSSRLRANYGVDPVDVVFKPVSTTLVEEVIRERQKRQPPSPQPAGDKTPSPEATATSPEKPTATQAPPPTTPDETRRTPSPSAQAVATRTAGPSPSPTTTRVAKPSPTRTISPTIVATDTPVPTSQPTRPPKPTPKPTNTPKPPPTNTPKPPPTNTPKPPPPTKPSYPPPTSYPLTGVTSPGEPGSPVPAMALGMALFGALVFARLDRIRR